MISRCYNEKHHHYANYGGRGITVCQRWRDSFAAFLADVGPRPSPQHSLDRYPDNNGNYEPGNVRWATRSEQQRNRRVNHLLTFQGKTQCVIAWAEELGINPVTIIARLRAGRTIEEALFVGRRKGPTPEFAVRRVWQLLQEGLSYPTISGRTGVSAATVARICRGETWGWLTKTLPTNPQPYPQCG